MGSSGFIEQSIKVRQQGVPDAAYQIHYTTSIIRQQYLRFLKTVVGQKQSKGLL